MSWFVSGISLLATILGLLVGGSHSPVAGVAITATFGVVLAAFAALQQPSPEKFVAIIKDHLVREDPTSRLEPVKETIAQETIAQWQVEKKQAMRRSGIMLCAFSVFFLFGMGTGTWLRNVYYRIPPSPRSFPWTMENKPASAFVALDWLVVQEQLLSRGFTAQQVSELYSWSVLSEALLQPSFGSQMPLSSLFSGLPVTVWEEKSLLADTNLQGTGPFNLLDNQASETPG